MSSQQRSQSGPSGLSINTGSANLFGSNNNNNVSQAPQSGGLFGSSKPGGLFGSSTTAAPSAGTLFGGSTTTTTQSNSLFGSTATDPSKAGTLFGGNATHQVLPQQGSLGQPAQGGSLFGNPAQPQQSTSLFGSTPAQNQQNTGLLGSTNQPQQSTGLFGSSNTQPQQQQTSGFFGSLNQPQSQNQQQQQQPGSMFGAFTNSVINTSNMNRPNSSLFNNTQTSQNTQRPAFAQASVSTLNPPQQTQQSLFSTSIGQYTAAQQTIPGVRIDVSNIRPTTRFNDLYEGLQKEIEYLDSFILNQMNLHSDCEGAMPRISEVLQYIPNDVAFCEAKLDATQRALENDAVAVDAAKSLVRADSQAARTSFKAIHHLRMPAQFHQSSLWNAPGALAPTSLTTDTNEEAAASANLVSYFSQQADEMSRKLDTFQKNIGEVEAYLSGLEANSVSQLQSARFSRGRDGGTRSADDQVRELGAVLREFEGAILTVAGKVGAVREEVQESMLSEGLGRRGRG